MNFGGSLPYLLGAMGKDALAEASAEVGLLFGAVGGLLGSIWGRPTWGVYWTWGPRLTTAAILLVALSGYLALRRFVETRSGGPSGPRWWASSSRSTSPSSGSR